MEWLWQVVTNSKRFTDIKGLELRKLISSILFILP